MIAKGGRHHAGIPRGVWFWPSMVRANSGLCAARSRRSHDRISQRVQPNCDCKAGALCRFPMPTFGFREWLVGLIAGVVLCFALTPLAARNARWLRPLVWFYALLMFFNGTGHTVFTILGRTLASVTFPRPAPGFYSSPFLFIGSVWLMVRLWKTASAHDFPFAHTNSLSS